MQDLLPFARVATEADAHLPTYDFTKINAVFTCPTWGVIRYGHNKVMSPGARAMALEAGQAMHQVFAAVRLYDWMFHAQPRDEVLHAHLKSCLPFADPEELMKYAAKGFEPTDRTAWSMHVLHACGFTDDEYDKRRTMSSLEEATILYNRRWDDPGPGRFPVYYNPSTGFLGIEVAFDIVISFGDVSPFRFVGRIDGVHLATDGSPRIQENKTGSRIDGTWAASFATSHQVTGYAFATSVVTGLEVRVGDAIGTQIPPPRNRDLAGIVSERFERTDLQFRRWFEWMLTGVSMYETYMADPRQAPQFMACNRYFRPCSLIPFCSADEETQLDMLQNMAKEVWSPLRGEGEKE